MAVGWIIGVPRGRFTKIQTRQPDQVLARQIEVEYLDVLPQLCCVGRPGDRYRTNLDLPA